MAGEELILLPDRALFWPARGALMAADLHWGKAAFLQAKSIPVPEGATREDLDRMSRLIEGLGAQRLWILGDLVHGRQSWSREVRAAVAAWRRRHAGIEMVLVQGNHDRRGAAPPPELGMNCTESLREGPFLLKHAPGGGTEEGYCLAGHVHPAIRLRGRGGENLRLPCFLFGPRSGLLPAFGGFTGAALVRPQTGDRAFVCVDHSVIRVAPRAARAAG